MEMNNVSVSGADLVCLGAPLPFTPPRCLCILLAQTKLYTQRLNDSTSFSSDVVYSIADR